MGRDEPGELQHRVLEHLESARNYNAWIASLALPYLGADPVEIGSGLGGNAAHWLGAGVPRLTVSDIGSSALAALRARFEDDARVDIAQIDLLQPEPGEHSALVAVNVLEHIHDDVAALRAATVLVEPAGNVVVFVPAFEFAMSPFDRALGHFRRYTVATLADAFAHADLEVVRCHYVNAPGLLAWTLGMRCLRLTPRDGALLRLWDRVVIPVTRRLESRRPPPFGQSILCVGRAPS